MKIIVTDLTRFSNPEIVCIAGVDLTSRRLVRPMPYLKTEICRKLNILPGAIIEGDFKPKPHNEKPHIEDFEYKEDAIMFLGPSSAGKFKEALLCGLVDNIETGFNIELNDYQKFIPSNKAPDRSIITIILKSISIVKDKFNPEKLKAVFTDSSDKNFYYIPITDIGFHGYAESEKKDEGRRKLNSFIRRQDEVFLRIGLSRYWEHEDGRKGFWLQVNGIYTFPDYLEDIRCHR